MERAALRIALALEDPRRPPDWCVRLVAALAADDALELVALVHVQPQVSADWGNPLIRGLAKIERRLFARPVPSDRASFDHATRGVPVLELGDDRAIASLAPDVIVNLAGEAGSAADPSVARHGIWFLDFLRKGPGFAGIAFASSGRPVTTIALQRMMGGGRPCDTIAELNLNPKFIAALNELFLCEKAVPLLLRELRRTWQAGAPQICPDAASRLPESISTKDYVGYLCGAAGIGLRRILDEFRSKARLRPGMFFLKSAKCDLAQFKPEDATAHISAHNSYIADPFLWERDGELFCFFEDFDYGSRRGHIAVGRFEGDELVEIQAALQTGYHLSFPFLFEHQGELFMMPETNEKRRIEIWRCAEFPSRWELHRTALEGVCAADTTLNLIDGEWWLFTNISTDPFLEMNSELHLFRVDGPDLSVIEPHELNPVVMDSRTARNAGRILHHEGMVLRPSQDNSHGTYGYGLNLMEVCELSLSSYKETRFCSIEPDFEPGLIGCHHLDIRSGRIVIDVRKRLGGRPRLP